MVPYPDLKLQQSVDQVQPPCLIPSLPSQGQMESVHKHILKLCCAVHPFKLSDGGHMIKHLHIFKICCMLSTLFLCDTCVCSTCLTFSTSLMPPTTSQWDNFYACLHPDSVPSFSGNLEIRLVQV